MNHPDLAKKLDRVVAAMKAVERAKRELANARRAAKRLLAKHPLKRKLKGMDDLGVL